jgi:hypothetical protein
LDEAVGEMQAHPSALERGGFDDAWERCHGFDFLALQFQPILTRVEALDRGTRS